MKTRISIVLLFATLLSGCGNHIDHDSIVLSGGGYTQLKLEARSLFSIHSTNESYSCTGTNLPSLLLSLNPQIVQIHERTPPVLNIQTLGGFNHQGLLVVLNTNSTHKPVTGRKWGIVELSPGVWQYRE